MSLLLILLSYPSQSQLLHLNVSLEYYACNLIFGVMKYRVDECSCKGFADRERETVVSTLGIILYVALQPLH